MNVILGDMITIRSYWFSHDSVSCALLLQLLDQPLSAYWRVSQEPCCINEIDVDGGRIQVLRVNETRHLDRIATDS